MKCENLNADSKIIGATEKAVMKVFKSGNRTGDAEEKSAFTLKYFVSCLQQLSGIEPFPQHDLLCEV